MNDQLVDITTKKEAANILGLHLGLQGQQVDARELTGELYSLPKYVISGISCMPPEFRLFQLDGYENFFIAVANQFFYIIESGVNDEGTGVYYVVVNKWDKINQLWMPL